MPRARYVPPAPEAKMGGVYASPRWTLLRTRQAWRDHVMLTRSLIINAAQGGAPPERILEALDRNADVIADLLGAVYGGGAATGFRSLFAEDLDHLAAFVGAAKAGGDATGHGRALDANALAMADFLSAQSPSSFDRREWRQLLVDHVAFTAQEALALIRNDNERDAYWFQKALMNADALAAAQFKAQWASVPWSERSWSPFRWEVRGSTFGEAARGRPGIYR